MPGKRSAAFRHWVMFPNSMKSYSEPLFFSHLKVNACRSHVYKLPTMVHGKIGCQLVFKGKQLGAVITHNPASKLYLHRFELTVHIVLMF